MNNCNCENWTIKDIAEALNSSMKDNKHIVVPMFQRGKRWNKEQELTFIDSMEKGYPVGTMLFYKKIENGIETYILVDGLQRGNSIRKFIMHPTEFFRPDAISDETCSEIARTISADEEMSGVIRSSLVDFTVKHDSYSINAVEYFKLAKQIISSCSVSDDSIESLISLIQAIFDDNQKLYDKIASSIIPVIVYQGDETTLPDIFDRINSKGTPLSQYEVYAASWPINEKFVVNESSIISEVAKKYDAFIEDGYTIDGYDKQEFANHKALNSFEFMFGLGKYLATKYPILSFNTKLKEDETNSISFELVNACLNDSDKINLLYKDILSFDANVFLEALKSSIKFVEEAVSPITRFKSNKHSKNEEGHKYHSKYQIMSMISTVFKEMYCPGDYANIRESWNESKSALAENLQQYYIYDILTKFWAEGGTQKIFTVTKQRKYLTPISSITWRVALDSYFESTMMAKETQKFRQPSNEDYVILNAVHLKTFSALDQLSADGFDIEHLAPKKQMEKMIRACKCDGLPVSSIANLCYLPDSLNRSKQDKNLYQDAQFIKSLAAHNTSLDEIEAKYTFTSREDMEWMDLDYTEGDEEILKEYYTEFCRARYCTIRKAFFDFLKLEVPEQTTQSNENIEDNDESSSLQNIRNSAVADELATRLGKKLHRISKKYYMSEDNTACYVITPSKPYSRKGGKLYWYGFRRLDDIPEHKELFYVWTHKDDMNLLVIPEKVMEEMLARVLDSRDDEGNVKHWHIKFIWYDDGHVTSFVSIPEKAEIDMADYRV